MSWNEYIFVGYSEVEDFEKYTVARTNRAGLDFLATTFTTKKVKGFELNKSDIDPRENALHLDCCFQPIGKNMAIIYKGGFKNEVDVNFLGNYFGAENIIEISKEEMYNMNANVFSISEQVIVSEKGFTRLNTELRKRGFTVEEVPYAEIAKMEGLLRCSTIPLIRE
jgi:N-dimethylarginine dimethylaminohydrolase